jgi:imidazolonepropionase-like amidohydrolase
MRRRALLAVFTIAAAAPLHADTASDLAAARALFEKNLGAIAAKDTEVYLSTYLQSPELVRTGPTGFALGYDELAAGTGSGWPDTFEGHGLQLTPVQPGVVYGTYRYRVRYGKDESSGLSERLFVKTAAGEWKIAVTSAFESPPGTPPPPLALVGATLIDGTGRPAVSDSVVVVRNGEIDCAGRAADCQAPDGIHVLDVRGKWLMPGLIDMHVHFSQTGWADARPDALDVRASHPFEVAHARLRERPEPFFRSWLCSGVTAVFDVGGMSWTTALPARAAGDARAPAVRAAGPLLSTISHEILNLPGDKQLVPIADEAGARGGVRYLAAIGADAVKVWFIRAEDAAAAAVMAAGDEAKRAGVPLIAHATSLDAAKVALRAGAKLLVHSVEDADVDAEFLELAKAGGAAYCPTLTVLGGYVRLHESAVSGAPPVVDDPNGCVDPATLERVRSTAGVGASAERAERLARSRTRAQAALEQSRRNLLTAHRAGIPIVMGTDAGNPLTLHGPSVHAELEAMQASGLTTMEVIVASTSAAAAALPRGDKLGSIEAGKLADILVLAADPSADVANVRKLEHVVRAGVARSVAELAAAVAATESR